MQKFTKELVDKYADDLLIGLTEEENKLVLEEFSFIEEAMEKISKFPYLKDIEPMTHPFLLDDVILRSDFVKEELSVEEVLQNAKEKTHEEVIVPKVVE